VDHASGEGMKMTSEEWRWVLRAVEKFAALGVPALVTLLFWRRRRVEAVTRYRATWANFWCSVGWLAACVLTALFYHSAIFRNEYMSSVPLILLSFCPLLFGFASLILCLACFTAKRAEQPFILLSNLLMLCLWASSAVAPN
jgi:hypothetical protein